MQEPRLSNLMDDVHRGLLLKYWQKFQKDLEPVKLLSRLVDILTPEDNEIIKAPSTRIDRVDIFLDLLSRRGDKAFDCFLQALKKVQPHLAKMLREDEAIIEERVSSANLRKRLWETEEQLQRDKSRNSDIQKDNAELKRIHVEQLEKLHEQILKTEASLKTYFEQVFDNRTNFKPDEDENGNTIPESIMKLNNELEKSQQKEKVLELKCDQLQSKLQSLESKQPLQDRSTSPIPVSYTELSPCERCEAQERKCVTLLRERDRNRANETQKLNEAKAKYEEQVKMLEKRISFYEKNHVLFVEEAKKRLRDKDDELKNLIKDNKTLKRKIKSNEKELKEMRTESELHRSEKEELLEDLNKIKEIEKRSERETADLMARARKAEQECDRVTSQLEQWKYIPGRVLNFNKPFDRNGIIYTLSKENISIHTKRSSDCSGEPKDILNHSDGRHSCTDSREGSWWQIDLGDNVLVFPNHYALRHGGSNGHGVIINWRLEWSRDGRKWKVLRDHKNERKWYQGNDHFPHFTGSWSLSPEGQIDAVRYLRIYQTGKNSSGDHALYLSGIEIYGVLLSM